MSSLQLDLSACRGRQQRLTEWMRRQELDYVLVSQAANLQWLCGPWLPWVFTTAAVLDADGRLSVALPQSPQVEVAADEVLSFESQWRSTLRNDQSQAAWEALGQTIQFSRGARIGLEFSAGSMQAQLPDDVDLVDIEPAIYQLRRRKDDDELAMIKRAIAGTQRMYQRAREIIRPGVTELHVFNELQAAAVLEFGEPTTRTGNDYQCGSRGGPPRNERAASAGELYILDLGPAYRGYFADNCRTFAVTETSTEQQAAWAQIMLAFQHVEANVRPGKSCRELFHEVQAILDASPHGVFDHHLGHGIGLFPHEAPHLNPHWDDQFEVGDVFTAEPGLYAPELQGGMRIENNYRVTADGIEHLTNFSMEL